jgi:molybdopterin synthase sulfur carrier subunit
MEVGLTGSLRSAAGGAAVVEIEANTIRELLNRIVDRYPEMNRHMEAGIAVSINGEIYRDDWSKDIPQDAEVFLLPRIQGG